jgi:raffinose/stachyose/melibiose transport system substrate-binding protein
MDYCNTQSSYTPLEDNRTPSDSTIAPSVEYLFNGQNVIGSDYRLELPLDNAEQEVGKAMLQGMSTEEAKVKIAQLLRGN